MGNGVGRGVGSRRKGAGAVPVSPGGSERLPRLPHVLRWVREGLRGLSVLPHGARAVLCCVGCSVAEVPEGRGDGYGDMVRGGCGFNGLKFQLASCAQMLAQ